MLVSVIIPCYNVADYIAECLESVFLQLYSPIEIICVDNNSTDLTFDIITEYAIRYPDKVKVYKEEQKGASFARNKGLMHANGEWIQFLDADDLLMPDKLLEQIEIVNSNKNVSFIVGSCYKENTAKARTELIFNEMDRFKALFSNRLGNTCSNLFNKNNLLLINGWNNDLQSSQETDLMFRLLKMNDNVYYHKQARTIIRERAFGQISTSNLHKNLETYIQVRLSIIKYLQEMKQDYFAFEADFYFQFLFSKLRELSAYNLSKAESIFKTNFPPKFIPKSKSIFSIYRLFFLLLGFKTAERIIRLIKK